MIFLCNVQQTDMKEKNIRTKGLRFMNKFPFHTHFNLIAALFGSIKIAFPAFFLMASVAISGIPRPMNTSAPYFTVTPINGTLNANGWFNSSVFINLIPQTSQDGSASFISVTYSVSGQVNIASATTYSIAPIQLSFNSDGVSIITYSGEYAGGEVGPFTYDVNIDENPPVITVTAPSGSGNYYAGQNIPVSFSCQSAVSQAAIQSCVGSGSGGAITSGQNISFASAGSQTLTFTATDVAGNSAQTAITINIQAAPVSVTITTPANNAQYVQNQQVTTQYTCPGGTSPVTCIGSVSSGAALDTSKTGTFQFTVTATDANNVTATGSAAYTVLPLPTSVVVVPASGAEYTLNENVIAQYSCSGGIAPLVCTGSAQNGSAIDTGSLGGHTFTVTVADAQHNTQTVHVSYTVVNGPTASISAPANNAQYDLNQQAQAQYTCGGDLTPISCTGTTASGAYFTTASLGSHTYIVTAVDTQNNTAAATVTYTVVVDPAITITAPENGQVILQNTQVPAQYSCSGGVAPLQCAGSAVNGAPVNTANLGAQTFTVTVTDAQGQTITKSVTYTVAPPVAAVITTPAQNGQYDQNEPIDAAYSCSGGVSPITCSGPIKNGAVIDTSKTGTFTFVVSATDSLNGSASATVTYTVVAPPTIILTQPINGQVFLQNAQANAQYSCSGGIAPLTCSGSAQNNAALNTATAGAQTFTVTATDAHNQTVKEIVQYTVVAALSATITTPANNAVYDINQQIMAQYVCAGGAAPVSCSGSAANGTAIDTTKTGKFVFSVEAQDTAKNTVSATSSYTVAADPTITITAPANNAVYHVGDTISAQFSCSGGSPPLQCSGTAANNAPIDTTASGTKTFTATVTDSQGQTAAQTVTYTVVSQLTVSVQTPAQNAQYAQGAVVNAVFSCSGGAPPVIDQPTSPNNAPIDTNALGAHTFTVICSDAADASAKQSVAYTIISPAPILKALSQQLSALGAGSVSVNVVGSDFTQQTSLTWNGQPLQTTYISPTQLTASIPAANVANEQIALVSADTAPPGGGISPPIGYAVVGNGLTNTLADTGAVSTGGLLDITAETSSQDSAEFSASGAGSAAVMEFDSNPAAIPVSGSGVGFFGVTLQNSGGISTAQITVCEIGAQSLYWTTGAVWTLFSRQQINSTTKCIQAAVTDTTSPSLNQLAGIFVAAIEPLAPTPVASPTPSPTAVPTATTIPNQGTITVIQPATPTETPASGGSTVIYVTPTATPILAQKTTLLQNQQTGSGGSGAVTQPSSPAPVGQQQSGQNRLYMILIAIMVLLVISIFTAGSAYLVYYLRKRREI